MNYKNNNKNKRHKKSKGIWRLNKYFSEKKRLKKELLNISSSKDVELTYDGNIYNNSKIK